MSQEDLIPLNKRPIEEARAIQSAGGSTISSEKQLASIIAQSRVAKCKNCPANCLLKEGNLRLDSDHLCTVPEGRGRAIFYNMPVMSQEVLLKLSHENMLEIEKVVKTAKDRKILHDVVKEKLDYEHPKPKVAITADVSQVANPDELRQIMKKWFTPEEAADGTRGTQGSDGKGD